MTECDWEKLYLAAVTETDWFRIGEHIEAAASAMNHRLHQLSLNHKRTPYEIRTERERIRSAAESLDLLRNDVARWKALQE